MVVPITLRQRILTLAHYTSIAGHLEQRQMYDTLQHNFFWPYMANDVYNAVDQCSSCARNRNRNQHKQPLQLFSPTQPLHFVAMNILCPLPKTTNGNQYVTVIKNSSSKRTWATPSPKTTSTHFANIFLHHWIVPYGIPSFLLTDNGTQFVFKFFADLCGFFGVRHLATTAYHLQPNGQAQRFNKTVVTRHRHYGAKHQHG